MLFWGLSLLVSAGCLFVVSLYCVLFSSYMPQTGIPVRSHNTPRMQLLTARSRQMLDAVKKDEHYKYLVPLLVPASLVAVIASWGGLKYFRHA
jgi:hypothetical protein